MISEKTRLKMRLAKLGKKRLPCSLETKEKIRNSNLGKKRSIETKLKQSLKKKEYYSHKENIEKFKARMKKYYCKIRIPLEYRICKCGCLRLYKCKINSKREFINGHNRRNQKMSKISKLKIKNSMRILFKNEDYRKKILRKRKISFYESRIIQLISDFKLPYKFVGNGKIWIGNRNPDFININGEKKVIEVYGRFQKARNYGSSKNYEKNRVKHYKKYGFEAIFLSDKEILNKNWKKVCLYNIRGLSNV